MIVIGDLHLRKKEEYFNAQVKFLEWLNENYSNEIIIFLGDVFDSNPHWNVYSEFKWFLKYRKNHTYILRGNHDSNFRSGEYLKGIHLMDNVSVFFEQTVVDIDGFNCLMLPHKDNMKEEYEKIEGDYDFCFTHITPPECAFGNEGIQLKIKTNKTIHGHTHIAKKWGNQIVIGTPFPTRNLETTNPIIEIEIASGTPFIREIQTPEFLKIETINYEDDVNTLNKSFIYNIKGAPSIKSVYEKFKGYYIRHEGIELKASEIDSDVKFDFDSNNLMKYFKQFIDDNNINKEYSDIIAGYLLR